MRGPGFWQRGGGVLEQNALTRKKIGDRGPGALRAVTAESIGSQGIDGDQDDAGPVSPRAAREQGGRGNQREEDARASGDQERSKRHGSRSNDRPIFPETA